MKALIKIVTAQKKFSPEDLDAFRRVLNMLRAHDLAVNLTIKEKIKTEYNIKQSKLRLV
jgi:hypothetical protein